MQKLNIFAKKLRAFCARNKFWIILFFAVFLIVFLAPPTGDDFTFMNYQRNFPGVGGFFESSFWMFENLNGRIVGNGTMFALSNFQILSSLFQALIIFAIIWSITKIIAQFTKFPNKKIAPLVALFVLLTPIAMYRQTYGWSSGFYNYVLPVALILLATVFLSEIFCLDRKNQTKKNLPSSKSSAKNQTIKKSQKIIFRIKLFLIAFCIFLASLCVENITLGILFFALILFAISFKFNNKNFRFATFALLFGAILGTILMFSSPVYQKIADGKDGYRSIEVKNQAQSKCSIFPEKFAKYCAKFSENVNNFSNLLLNEKYYLIYATTIFAVIFLFHKKYFGLKHRKFKFLKRPIFAKIFLSVLILILIFVAFRAALFSSAAESAKIATILKFANFAAALGFYFVLALIFFVYNKNRAIALLSSFLISASFICVAPLLFVSPFGYRNFYISFVFLNFAILLVFIQILPEKILVFLRKISLTGLIGVFAIFLFANAANFAVFLSNDSKAKSAIKNSEKVVEFRQYIFKNFKYFNNESKFSQRVTKMYYNHKECIYAIARTCHGGNNLEIKFQK